MSINASKTCAAKSAAKIDTFFELHNTFTTLFLNFLSDDQPAVHTNGASPIMTKRRFVIPVLQYRKLITDQKLNSKSMRPVTSLMLKMPSPSTSAWFDGQEPIIKRSITLATSLIVIIPS